MDVGIVCCVFLMLLCSGTTTSNENDGDNSFFKCKNGGTFDRRDDDDEGRCLCADNFSGEHCEKFIDPCYASPCGFGATCRVKDFKMKCDCADGYTGELCDQEISSALNISSTTKLISMTNSESSSTASTNSMLTTSTTPRFNYSTVSKELNSNQTVEPTRFTSTQTDGRSTGETYSSSNTNSDDPLSSLEENTSITTEYSTDSFFECENGGTFVSSDYEGGDRCICAEYFYGEHCEKFIDKCYESPCRFGATCRFEDFKIKCDCADGYTGELCDQEIPSALNISSTTILTSMTNSEFSSSSATNTMLTTTKSVLEHSTVSKELVANTNQTFEPTSFTSTQTDYWSTEETYPMTTDYITDPCFPNPCQNNQTCVLEPDENFYCKCNASYKGKLCEKDNGSLDLCVLEPCSNGGKNCKTEKGKPKCECPEPFTGPFCELKISTSSTISSTLKHSTNELSTTENTESTRVKENTTTTESLNSDSISDDSISSDETSSGGTTTEDSNTNTENSDSTSVKEDNTATESLSPDTTSDDLISSNIPNTFGTTTDNLNIYTENIYLTTSKEDDTTPDSLTAGTTQSVASTNTDDNVTEVEIDKKKASKRNVAYICGGIGGGLGIIFFIAGIIYYLKRLKKIKHLLYFKSADSSSMGSSDSTSHLA